MSCSTAPEGATIAPSVYGRILYLANLDQEQSLEAHEATPEYGLSYCWQKAYEAQQRLCSWDMLTAYCQGWLFHLHKARPVDGFPHAFLLIGGVDDLDEPRNVIDPMFPIMPRNPEVSAWVPVQCWCPPDCLPRTPVNRGWVPFTATGDPRWDGTAREVLADRWSYRRAVRAVRQQHPDLDWSNWDL